MQLPPPDSPLLSLPPELRLLIYHHLFAGSILQIDCPAHLINSAGSSPNPHRLARRKHLPGILIASKQIRSESLPIFSRQLHPIFYNTTEFPLHEDRVFPNHHQSLQSSAQGTLPPQLPPHYLAHATTATLVDWHTQFIHAGHIPNLRTLEIIDGFDGGLRSYHTDPRRPWQQQSDGYISSTSDCDENQVKAVIQAFRSSPLGEDVDDWYDDKRMPEFRIVLIVQMMLRDGRDWDVVIDYGKEEMVKKFRHVEYV